MAKFEEVSPELVIVGGGRHRGDPSRFIRETAPYINAVMEHEAGFIHREAKETPTKVKELLSRASHATGIKVRSTWVDTDKKTLGWKRVGESARHRQAA